MLEAYALRTPRQTNIFATTRLTEVMLNVQVFLTANWCIVVILIRAQTRATQQARCIRSTAQVYCKGMYFIFNIAKWYYLWVLI